MQFPTLSEVLVDVIPALGQVDGSAVQVYTEPLALRGVNVVFDMLYGKRRWEHIWAWNTFTLNGVTGLFTSSIPSGTRTPAEIGEVRQLPSERSITIPRGIEHLRATGSTPLYYTFLQWNDPDATDHVIRIWPPTATGQVAVYMGARPQPFIAEDDVVPMYKSLITAGVAWYLLADDGMNPDSAAKAQLIYDGIYKDTVAKLNTVEIGHGSGYRRNDTFSIP